MLGVAGAALQTEMGRALVVRTATGIVNEKLHGTLHIGHVGGSLVSGLDVRDIVLRGDDGEPVVELGALRLRYRVQDLLSGRFVLGRLVLERPRLNLVQRRGEPLNLEQLFPEDTTPGGGGGPKPFIAFNDVEILDGVVSIKTEADSTDPGIVEGESFSGGYFRVQRISGISVRLPYLRLASPLPSDRGILALISSLSAEMNDPAVQVRALRGQALILGESLEVNLPELRLDGTDAEVVGTLSWDQGPLLYDLDIRARAILSDDVLGLASDLPAGIAGTGRFHVVARTRGVIEVEGRGLNLEGLNGGGQVQGRLEMVLRPQGRWRSGATELRVNNFDLAYLESFLDSLPVMGRVTGTLSAAGPMERLAVELDVVFRDSLVEGWPESTIRGGGYVALGGPALEFVEFTVSLADLDLATVRRLLPVVPLQGRLAGRGALNGPFLGIAFEGELRHRDGALPETVVRGLARIDGRGDTLGVWTDLALDSLRLRGLQTSFPGLDLAGPLGGRVRLAGYLDSLAVDARLGGAAGEVEIRGAAIVLPGRSGAHDLRVNADRLNLHVLNQDLPETRIVASAEAGGLTVETGRLRGHADFVVQPSEVAGVPIDGARGEFTLADSVARIDTLTLWMRGITARGRGDFGLRASRTGVLAFEVQADSLEVLEPLLAGRLPTDTAAAEPAEEEEEEGEEAAPLSGTATASVEIRGSVDAFEVEGSFEAHRLRRGDVFVSRAEGDATWVSPFKDARIEAHLDSVHLGSLDFGGVRAAVTGALDSLGWSTAGRFGAGAGEFLAGGRLRRDSGATTVALDSLDIDLVSGSWRLDSSGVVAVSDSGVDFSRLALAHESGAGRLALGGRFPFRGPANLEGTFEAIALQDILLLMQNPDPRLSGDLNGNLRITGTARAPTLTAAVAIRDGQYESFRASLIEGRVDYEDRRMTGRFALWRLGEAILQIDVDLPLDLAFTAVEQRQLPGQLTVRAVADSVDLALVEALLNDVRRTGGILDADVGITGSWERPELTGRVTIADGAATFPALGVRHDRLNANLSLSGQSIRIDALTVRSGAGTAEMTGTVDFEELSRPRLDVHIAARQFRAIDVSDFLSVTATADLQLQGPPLSATLTGRGVVTEGAVYFADLLTKQVVNLEDTLFASFVDPNVIREQRLGAAFSQRFLDSLRINNLALRMGNDVWLRSTEANIQLSGEVSVDKVQDRYRIDGTLTTPRGTYRLPLGPASREFQVTRGEIRALGTPDLNADVDIDAQHKLRSIRGEEVIVLVHIGGTLYDPRLTLSSDVRPPLSETEIISYMLVGAPSVDALANGGSEGQRLLASQLAGVLSGQLEYALISDLGVPLDYLQIRPGDVAGGLSGTEIAIGKQFTVFGTSAFLSARPRFACRQQFVDVVGASLEFRLTRNWVFAASADPLRGCEVLGTSSETKYQFGLDFLWEKSY